MINVISSSRYKINRRIIKHEAGIYLGKKGRSLTGVVNIVFVGKNKMKTVATTYKNESVALPVLSFKYDDVSSPSGLLAEIIICYPQAVLLAAERGKRVDDMINNLIKHAVNTLDL